MCFPKQIVLGTQNDIILEFYQNNILYILSNNSRTAGLTK